MIWYICFISLKNLFEIQLYSSYISHPLNYENSTISWLDYTHQHLLIETNKTNLYIDQCSNKLEYLIAKCFLQKTQTYQCQSIKQNRLKRNVSNKSKRSIHIILFIIIGILCFIVGIIVGIFIIAYISIKKRKKQQEENQKYKTNKQIEPVIKGFGINNEILKRLYVSQDISTGLFFSFRRQNNMSTGSPTFNSTSNQSSGKLLNTSLQIIISLFRNI